MDLVIDVYDHHRLVVTTDSQTGPRLKTVPEEWAILMICALWPAIA
jgi:hypothetical protein